MKRVVIIGAGPAGITAGLELLSKGKGEYDVTILEESGQIGGISRTVQVDGNRMDIGGHRFFSKSREVNDWWQRVLPMQGAPSMDDRLLCRESRLAEGGPNPAQTDDVMLWRRRISRIYYRGKFFDYPISFKPQTVLNLGVAQALCAGISYLRAAAFPRREASLEDFYINRFGKKLYSMFFEAYTEKLWGRPPREISADWGAQRVKGVSLIELLKNGLRHSKSRESSLIEEFKYPKLGPGALWESAAQQFEALGGKIVKNAKVTGVCTQGREVRAVKAETLQGKVDFTGEIFLSSMPLCDLIAAFHQTEIPQKVRTVAAGLPYRDFVTVGLLVDRMLLKNTTKLKTLRDIVPDCWIYVQDNGVKLGRIQVFNNWSPYMVADAENTVWLGLEFFCTQGDAFWNMPQEACIAFAADELVRIGVIDRGAVLRGHRERVKKAYPAYFDTYSELPSVVDFLNTFGNLYCIGRNGQHRYNNMDHSMMTAFEAVKNILSGRTDKSNVWNVNTENEYHEER